MQTPARLIAAAALLITSSAFAGYTPGVSDMPMSAWNYTHEPAVLGGAKGFEQTTAYNGKAPKGKVVVTLDNQGQEVRSELVGESGPSLAYVFKREGDLLEVTQVRVENGQETVYSRQKGAYAAKGNWTKATTTQTMQGQDGKEMKQVQEIVRKITY